MLKKHKNIYPLSLKDFWQSINDLYLKYKNFCLKMAYKH